MTKNQISKIKNNSLFITTTDTVLGIGGIFNEEVRGQLFEIKNRNLSKKLVIAINSIEMARSFKSWSILEEKLAKKYWPGPLTIVLDDEISLRMPNDNKLLKLIEEVGPIFLTSCNLSGQKQCKTLQEAMDLFGKKIKIFINTNNKKSTNLPSTIIYPKNNNQIIRQGTLKI